MTVKHYTTRVRPGAWRATDFFGGVVVGAGFDPHGEYVRVVPWCEFDFAIRGLP